VKDKEVISQVERLSSACCNLAGSAEIYRDRS